MVIGGAGGIMPAMVPLRLHLLNPIRAALRARWRALRGLARPLGWLLALWAVVVALPYGWLYPGERLTRPICVALALLAPAAGVWTATTGQARTLLATGLGALVPPLVACPELLSERVTGAMQGLLVAGLLLSFIAAALDADQGVGASANARMRALLRLRGLGLSQGVVLPGVGIAWLLLAWLPEQPHLATGAEAARTVRVAAVAATWALVLLVPLRPRAARPSGGPHRRVQPMTAMWWLQRGGVVALLLAVWGWWWA